MKLSLIIPCYNEAEALPRFRDCLLEVRPRLAVDELELVFVDDGSRDGTLDVLKGFHAEDPQWRYLSFSRNFGKESAIFAGLRHATGDVVGLMDADLQDPPSLLPEMLAALREEGYDIAATRRSTRKGEPVVRSFFARRFYRFINRISTTKLVDGARDFRLMKRPVVDAILRLTEYNRFSKGIFEWVGFKTKWFSYENIERSAGTTKWSLWKLLKYSIEGIMAFSTVPLMLAVYTGLLFSLIAILIITGLVIRHFIDPASAVQGWVSLTSIMTLLGGIQIVCIGLLGQYLAKTYLEVKNRPIYIIAAKSGDER